MMQYYTTIEKAEQYEAVINVFSALFKEVKDLGKKKPEASLSEMKIKMINRVLENVRECIEGEDEYQYLDLLEIESVPQFGDAILVLSQYEGALNSFRERHYGYDSNVGSSTWFIKKAAKKEA